MTDVGVIDRFLEVFTRYIDSGFGLLGGEVAWLAATLIVIDVTLAALFWAWGEGDDIVARLVKKTLFVGIFAYVIGNWKMLARIVFESFAGLGLKASGTSMPMADFLRPGRIAEVGLEAGRPILDAVSDLMGYVSFFDNFLQIIVLLAAWAILLFSFFILAIQLFVALIEFKLTTLAGFVLVPFGLFGKTAFMAERVLGNVISSGIKVLVLAVIVGIGSTLFTEFTGAFAGPTPTIDEAMSVALAALSLLALGIFGPGIANGIVAGGPQLGAGAAVGTGLAVGGAALAGMGATRMGASAVGAAYRGGSYAAAAATGGSRSAAVGAGTMGVATSGAAPSAEASPLRQAAAAVPDRFGRGSDASVSTSATASSPADGSPPAWARQMRRGQAFSHGIGLAAHALKSGDGGGAGTSVSVTEGR
jgi:type IV secretion system protein TrbL